MNLPQNTTERHSLAACGSHCGEKQFLLIFIHFYMFDQKMLFKHIQIFLRIFPFSNMVRKNKRSDFPVLVSEIATSCLKRKFLNEFPQKCFKTTERHSLAVCSSFVEKNSFVNIYPLLRLIKNSCLNISKFFPGFTPFQTW